MIDTDFRVSNRLAHMRTVSNLDPYPMLPAVCPVRKAVRQMAEASVEERGAVFTRRAVVDFILDLAGYTVDRPLASYRLLEPAFGDGDFLIPAIARLVAAWRRTDRERAQSIPATVLRDAIRAVEIHEETLRRTKGTVIETLARRGIDRSDARSLADAWILPGDFLLRDLPFSFTHAVGNPPYVRQERIPDVLVAAYRARYRTLYDRADLYVPFIERSLELLDDRGTLAFICADRWMKNTYGGPLRELVSRRYHLSAYVDMVDTPAFHGDVIAYPAITVIQRREPGKTRVAHRPAIDANGLSALAGALTGGKSLAENGVAEVSGVVKGRAPWILQSWDRLAVVRRLEAEYPVVEDVGCKVGIGVATGADNIFTAPMDALDVEPDRKLPLVKTKDIQSGQVTWRGLGVINPFQDNGKLVDLRAYPKLATYLRGHAASIKSRAVAKRNPNRWYRTIDRIHPALTHRQKLLIPDIKGEAHIVYEAGQLYPHHNLYFIISDEWDLHALQAVLRSGIARLFISTYSTRMRGGYLRYQAQYLRRIRIPPWADVPQSLRRRLVEASQGGNLEERDNAAFELYGLNDSERSAIEGNGTR